MCVKVCMEYFDVDIDHAQTTPTRHESKTTFISVAMVDSSNKLQKHYGIAVNRRALSTKDQFYE